MEITISQLPLIIILIQCVTYCIFFFLWKGLSQKKNAYLVVFFLLLSFQMAGLLLSMNGVYQVTFTRLNIIYGFIYGPLLYLYTSTLLYEKRHTSQYLLIHYIPFLASVVVAISGIPINYFVVYTLYLFISVVYFIMSGRVINNFRKVSLHTRSVIDNHKLNYLRGLYIIYLLVILSDTTQFLAENTQLFLSARLFSSLLVFSLIFLLVNFMFYFSVFYAKSVYAVSAEEEKIAEGISIEINANAVDIAMERPPEVIKQLAEIHQYVQVNKPYLDATLTLKELAVALNMPSRSLSEIINDNLKTNFSTYINTLRIYEAAERLKAPRDEAETIAEVMYTCGFNSKSAFFTAFKKQFAMTPKHYKEVHGK